MLRDAERSDLDAVLRLNEASVPAMNSLAPERMLWLWQRAASFRIAVSEDAVAGFLICLPSDAPYDSPNFTWLNRRLDDFLYVDRIAVDPAFRRLGIAASLYSDAGRLAAGVFGQIACEVNVRPRNAGSLAFHSSMGFRAIGTQDHGCVAVRYFVRPLPF